MKIVWIDDAPGRKNYADNLGATFLNAKNQSFEEEMAAFMKGKAPDLVIVDHFLDNLAGANWMLRRGSTISEAIKAEWPETPVVCVTGADKVRQIDHRTRLAYDKLFDALEFNANIEQIRSIGEGFKAIRKKKPLDAKKLISLLKPPKDEAVRLGSALPDKLKSVLDESAASSFFEWVSHLVDRAGFLYDDLAAATFLGLNEVGFMKVLARFDAAKFTGVFSNANQVRWWSQLIAAVLFELVEPERGEMSWDCGRRLDNTFKTEDFSKCHKCGRSAPPPETVGYLDEASQERRAMHLDCSVLHPKVKREIFFDDVRIMEGD